MNCKQGDLAVIVKSNFEKAAIGRIVRCVRFNDSFGMPAWEFEPHFNQYWVCRDEFLRPIRDQPGEDETLTWAGLPADCGVPA